MNYFSLAPTKNFRDHGLFENFVLGQAVGSKSTDCENPAASITADQNGGRVYQG